MLLHFILGHIVLLLLPLALTAVLVWLVLIRLKANHRLGALLLLPGGILWLFLWGMFTIDVIVVDENLNVSRYMVIGHSTYTSTDGQTINVRDDGKGDVFIVNASGQTLADETISYGQPMFFLNFGPDIIPPHRTMQCRTVPDYFPDQSPPQSVSVNNGMKSASRDWLRSASESEMSNGDTTNVLPR